MNQLIPSQRIRLYFKFFLSIILLISSVTGGFAQAFDAFQNIKFEHISEGLSQSTVTCILQDKKGFLWFGTRNGLNRYDGVKFTTFENILSDSTSISHNYITTLFEDTKGNLWVGTMEGGLNLFDKENETFKRFKSTPQGGHISHNNITCIYEDYRHKLWIGTENGLNYYVPEKQDFVYFKYINKNAKSLSNNNISAIFEDEQFNLWLGTKGGGLKRFDQKNQKLISYLNDGHNPKSISNNVINTVFKDSKKQIWVGTQNGLNRLVQIPNGIYFEHYQHEKLDPNSLGNNVIVCLSEDLLGRIWIGTQLNGLYIYDQTKQIFSNLYPDPLQPYSISSNSVWSVYRDKTGAMWLGVRNRGLNKWDFHQKQFKHYNVSIAGNQKLTNNDVTCFEEDQLGNLWIGTDGGGLRYFDKKTNQYTHYFYNPKDKNSLGSNAVISLHTDKQQRLWVGTWGGGLNLFNAQTRTFKHYLHTDSKGVNMKGKNVYAMYEDSFGNFWVGTYYDGLNLYDPTTDSFKQFLNEPNTPNSLGSNLISVIFEDSRKNLWIGTNGGGLDKLNRKNGNFSFTHHKFEGNKSGQIGSNLINTITEDSKHNLWVGTSKGFYQFDYNKNIFTEYSKENGLPDNVINGVLEDSKGFLWISTNQGISKFNPSTQKFINYSVADGLQSPEFLKGAFFKSKSGAFFFGGINGYNSFYPEKIRDNKKQYPLYLTELKINNLLVKPNQPNSPLEKHISETQTITLSHDNNDFSIGFASLNYSAPNALFTYTLEGYDKTWKTTSMDRSASYAKVPSGSYIFRVKRVDTNDKTEVKLRIHVLPPWWKTWWAYLFYSLIAIALLWWYRQLIIKQLRLESDLKLEHLELTKMQEMERLKSSFFAKISHEFRTPLTMILSPLKDMYQEQFEGNYKNQYQLMIRSSERLLRLINQLLDLSKLDSGKMTLVSTKFNLIDFLKTIFLSFDSFAHKKGISYELNCSEDAIFVLADADKLEKIVTNLLSNAFKFTEVGSIELSIQTLEEASTRFVEILVSDTGIGIPADSLNYIFDHFYQVVHKHHTSEGSGIGLALTKELVELHQGTIDVTSQIGKGTTFRILLPICASIQQTPAKLAQQNGTITDFEPISMVDGSALTSTDTQNDELQPLILLVEDNDDVRNYLHVRLCKKYNVIEATNGEEGLQLCLERIPDLIISDILMPKMNGIDMCRALKNDVQTSHIPLILLTAQTDSANKIEGLETGADDYVSKPFDSNELEIRVKNLINSRKLLAERFAQSRKLILEPSEITITPLDELFMKKVLVCIEANISDSDFRVEDLGKELGMSRMPLYKKIKALTGQTAVEFVRNMRLKRAAQLLKQQQLNVSEITYEVGFTDLQYFRTCFKKEFGVSPSEYAKFGSEENAKGIIG
ncbi:signal transduction histidine kinase [Arcicella aurantiaca]|uniref:histidine kinase n=1 Tax=Arcicella aurantiaca TaxID=591202 RepID=A0A316DYM9_9BACT|nr:two-component regulator propeller domain-containing protein [Arcicella aurantiaca]PWK22349.1 signal transduction histidine kinase [Arcicella aurantiaca]